MDQEHGKAESLWQRMLRPALRAILTSNDSPRQIAMGSALGVFIAFTPTMGLQTFMSIIFATLLRVSRIPCVVFVYITNPLTALPVYGLCYWVGTPVCRLLGLPVGSRGAFNRFREAITGQADLNGLAYFRHVCEQFGAFGLRIAAPLWVGGTIVGLVGGALCYFVVLRIVEGHRVLRAQRLAHKLQKRAREDEEEVEEEPEPPASEEPGEAPEPDKETAHELGLDPTGRTGTHRVDPPPEKDAAGGHRRSG